MDIRKFKDELRDLTDEASSEGISLEDVHQALLERSEIILERSKDEAAEED